MAASKSFGSPESRGDHQFLLIGEEIRRIDTRKQLAAMYRITDRADVESLEPSRLTHLNGFDEMLINPHQPHGIDHVRETALLDFRKTHTEALDDAGVNRNTPGRRAITGRHT